MPVQYPSPARHARRIARLRHLVAREHLLADVDASSAGD